MGSFKGFCCRPNFMESSLMFLSANFSIIGKRFFPIENLNAHISSFLDIEGGGTETAVLPFPLGAF